MSTNFQKIYNSLCRMVLFKKIFFLIDWISSGMSFHDIICSPHVFSNKVMTFFWQVKNYRKETFCTPKLWSKLHIFVLQNPITESNTILWHSWWFSIDFKNLFEKSFFWNKSFGYLVWPGGVRENLTDATPTAKKTKQNKKNPKTKQTCQLLFDENVKNKEIKNIW